MTVAALCIWSLGSGAALGVFAAKHDWSLPFLTLMTATLVAGNVLITQAVLP